MVHSTVRSFHRKSKRSLVAANMTALVGTAERAPLDVQPDVAMNVDVSDDDGVVLHAGEDEEDIVMMH